MSTKSNTRSQRFSPSSDTQSGALFRQRVAQKAKARKAAAHQSYTVRFENGMQVEVRDRKGYIVIDGKLFTLDRRGKLMPASNRNDRLKRFKPTTRVHVRRRAGGLDSLYNDTKVCTRHHTFQACTRSAIANTQLEGLSPTVETIMMLKKAETGEVSDNDIKQYLFQHYNKN